MMTARARRWHRAHPLPRRANEAQRLLWHLEHQKCCGCRPMPAYLGARNDDVEPRKKKPLRKRQPEGTT